jgi:hypothetical protein
MMTHTVDSHRTTTRRTELRRTDAQLTSGNSFASRGSAALFAFAMRDGRISIGCVEMRRRAFATGDDR